MNIYLMGYMGSGKSTVGAGLAQILDNNFIDFDNYIEDEEGRTISKIFEEKGEIYFRKKEALYLKQLIDATPDNTVIALGGGTPCYGTNLEQLKTTGARSIYLNTSVQELTKRLWLERSKRPLIETQSSQDALEEFIRKHLFERGFYYNQATTIIKTDGKKKTEIIKEIIAQLF